MRARKLTDAQVEWIFEIGRKRALLPTQAALARELGVSKRLIEEIQAGRQYAKHFRPRQFTEQEIKALCTPEAMFRVERVNQSHTESVEEIEAEP